VQNGEGSRKEQLEQERQNKTAMKEPAGQDFKKRAASTGSLA
jgi:hypothetical protein